LICGLDDTLSSIKVVPCGAGVVEHLYSPKTDFQLAVIAGV
jgi:hypothetical protein